MTSRYKFGTFQGVFTPNILTILGVIMYLRFGWVLGNVGLGLTIVIVTLASFITLMTSFAISQLATNTKVEGGGAYYIISRSLGIEVGAAIGIPLFFAQALSISFYISGFAESVSGLFPILNTQTVAICTLLLLTLIAFISADFALKTQYLVMLAIILSLVSFFLGRWDITNHSQIQPLVIQKEGFWHVFSVFFPAVTGILAGLSMSGDLKSPTRSLPLGTISAVIVSYFIYLTIPFFLYLQNIDDFTLINDSLLMTKVSKWSFLVVAGIWGASLSSAVGSLLGAPRTLAALSRDKILPYVLSRGIGARNDPDIALGLSFFIALLGVCISSFNMIATLLTMFFLTSYGLLCFSAALEGMIQNPSWRPTFRLHWIFPLFGGIGCFMVMLLISPGFTFLAFLITGIIYITMQHREMRAYWGDMKYAILMLITRFTLNKLNRKKPHPKSWRPNILVLSGSPNSRWVLVSIADAFCHSKGFMTVGIVLSDEYQIRSRAEALKESIFNYLDDRNVPAILKLYTTRNDESILEGARNLVRSYGFGPLFPNTVLMGCTEKPESYAEFTSIILTAYRNAQNLILMKNMYAIPEFKKTIDIWWRRSGNNAGLMLALSFMLKTSDSWRDTELILKTLIEPEDDNQKIEHYLIEFLNAANIKAKINIIVKDGRSPFEQMRESSMNSDLVFMGLKEPSHQTQVDEYAKYYNEMILATSGFPAIAFILAAEPIDFKEIFQLHS